VQFAAYAIQTALNNGFFTEDSVDSLYHEARSVDRGKLRIAQSERGGEYGRTIRISDLFIEVKNLGRS
jgi:hypothetical protein